ncbi:hypothetical protein EU519_00225 [Candidatus Thorarchaeota archaeon]|nr:MAG: hypothetical protein EU519_00225 [Candidatus Thorarchaeota archaeon]
MMAHANQKPPSPKTVALNVKKTLKEPILRVLLERSSLTETQLETLLIDLVVEDVVDESIAYEDKAALRSRERSRSLGVSRGAFNRTLHQARRNVTRGIYTMLLLAYLDLFDFNIFRPFEEVAGKIRGYRSIRDVLAGRVELSAEDLESYRTAERTILSAVEELTSPLVLKSEASKKQAD